MNTHQITIFNKPITVHNYIVYSNKMFYGWKIVISVVLVLTVTGPTDVSTANIYQKAVTEALNISSSQCSISNTLINLGYLSSFIFMGIWFISEEL